VEFGPNGAKARNGMGHIQDVDGDGDLDMVLQFNTSETGIQCGETEASLTGMTINNENISGTDVIVTVACKLKSATTEQAKVSLKEGYALYQNYPNPFNSETEISFYLPEDNHVLLNIFNINGKIIQTLVNGRCSAGEHKIRWSGTDYNGTPVADGLYFYRLKTDSFNKVEKMSLIR
jgi:flagellar hook assembly protein FlgD